MHCAVYLCKFGAIDLAAGTKQLSAGRDNKQFVQAGHLHPQLPLSLAHKHSRLANQ